MVLKSIEPSKNDSKSLIIVRSSSSCAEKTVEGFNHYYHWPLINHMFIITISLHVWLETDETKQNVEGNDSLKQ